MSDISAPTVRYALIPTSLQTGDFLTVASDGSISGRKIDAFNLRGTVDDLADLDGIAGSIVGDMYFVTSVGSVYLWNGTDWEDVGPFPVVSGADSLANRPSATPLKNGTMYLAADDEAGRLWAVKDGNWIVAAPSVAQANAGRIVARAAPATDQIVTSVAGTAVRYSGFTTPSFPLPPNAVVELPSFTTSGHGSGGVASNFQIKWSTDGWVTSNLLAGTKALNDGGVPFYWAETLYKGPVMLPAVGQTLAVGTNVQVGLFVVRDDVKNITIIKNTTFGANPFIQVRAG